MLSQNKGGSFAKPVKPSSKPIKFADVAGMAEAKVEVMEFVEFLKNPGKFQALGAKVPKVPLLPFPPSLSPSLFILLLYIIIIYYYLIIYINFPLIIIIFIM